MSTPERPRDHDGDDIDAEFARLTEGLGLDAPDAASGGGDPANGDTEQPLTVEDVLASAEDTDGGEPSIVVIATAVASPRALAGAIRLGADADAPETDEVGTAPAQIPSSVRVHPGEFGALVIGSAREEDAHRLATIVSAVLQRKGIVLFWRRGERMTATRYRDGQRGEDVSPALVLGAVDPAVEQIVLGALDPAQLGEGHDPSALSREEAEAWIREGNRKRWPWQ